MFLKLVTMLAYILSEPEGEGEQPSTFTRKRNSVDDRFKYN